jgi:hypothetical protein
VPARLILQTVAGVWIPLEAAMVHYRALDSLLLSTEVQMRLGGATFERIRGTLLGTMLRFANDAGVTPIGGPRERGSVVLKMQWA